MNVDWSAPPPAALIALAAIALCWLLPRSVRLSGAAWHPVALISAAMGRVAGKLNRARRSPADRAIRGFATTTLFVGAAAAAGWLAEQRVAVVGYAWVAELALVVLLLDPRGVAGRVRAAARLLERDQPAVAARAVTALGEPLAAEADPHGVARVVAEHAARGGASAFVAPLFWYLALGIPGLVAAPLSREAALRMAGSAPSRQIFGITADGLDRALGVIPGWLTAAAMCVAAAFIPRARPVAAVKRLGAGGAWAAPEAALAGALDLSLGGPRRLRLAEERWREERPWIGSGRARVAPSDLRRAAFFLPVLSLLAAAALAAALPSAM